jgi:AraC-like DNA-binding protein
MALDWLDFIALFTLIQLIFLAVVTFNYKKGKRLSNLLLSGFMASNALLIANYILTHFGWISSGNWIGIYIIGGSMYFLLMPFLYLYIQSLCYKNFHLKTIHVFHLIPFVIFVSFSLFVYLLNNTTLRSEISISLRQIIGEAEQVSHKTVLHLQILLYLIASVVVLSGYRKRLRDLFSSIERIDLYWCNLLLAGFATMWFIDLMNWILGFFRIFSQITSYWMVISSLFINLIFTLMVTYKGLAQSASFSGIIGSPKYAASRLKPPESDNIARKLTEFMNSEKPYLSPSISVEELSKKLNFSVKNLSQVIHTSFNLNFYDFINSYRIEEIKKHIDDENYRNLTLVAIAYDAGFNSKSVFNAAFKKHAGITPKEYKSRHNA